MSSGYDPRRSRPRPASSPDPEAAPIDALLGPEPDPSPDEPAPDADAGADIGAAPAAPVAPRPHRPAPTAGAPSKAVQLLPLVVLGSLVALVVWWLTRRRAG